jgi:hypothetical protein
MTAFYDGLPWRSLPALPLGVPELHAGVADVAIYTVQRLRQ